MDVLPPTLVELLLVGSPDQLEVLEGAEPLLLELPPRVPVWVALWWQVGQPPGSPCNGVSEIKSKQPIPATVRDTALTQNRRRMCPVLARSRRKIKSAARAIAARHGRADHSRKMPCSEKMFGPTSMRPVKPTNWFTTWQVEVGLVACTFANCPTVGSML